MKICPVCKNKKKKSEFKKHGFENEICNLCMSKIDSRLIDSDKLISRIAKSVLI